MRGAQKEDHREFRAVRSRQIGEWMRFRGEDLTQIEVETLAGDLVRRRKRVRALIAKCGKLMKVLRARPAA